MKIIKCEIDNFFRFKNFEIDFTHPRKVKNLYRDFEKEEISNINVNDINILIGANATGKTALGKCLWFIELLIGSRNIYEGIRKHNNNTIQKIAIEYIKTIKKDKKDYIFRYEVEFYNSKIKFEKLSYFTLTKGKNYKKELFKPIVEFNNQVENENKIVQSEIFTTYLKEMQKEGYEEEKRILSIASKQGFLYTHSGEKDITENFEKFDTNKETMIENIETFIKQIDSRIEKLEKVENNVNEIEFFMKFKEEENKTYVNIEKHHPEYKDLRGELSSGTIEALIMFIRYYQIKKQFYNVIFLDEQLTYIHFELEKEILALIMATFPKDSQLFYTSHNPEIMKMNLPLTFYHIMYKDDCGYIRALKPSKYLSNKNDRNELYEKVINDYFNTSVNFDFGDFYD